MIVCKKCGYDNPMTTTFCRGCGERLEFTMGQVAQAVSQGNAEKRDVDILGWGRSALSLCGFALIAVIIVRTLVIPAPPPADLPRVSDLQLFESEPDWAKGAVAGPTSASLDDLVAASDRLTWRLQTSTPTLSAFSLDLGPLTAAQDRLIALQKQDGSFPGPRDLSATALATLGLQAMPRSDAHLEAAAKGRAWLDRNWDRLTGAENETRAMALAAFFDAEAIDDRRRRSLGATLVDGSAPLWQTICILGLPGAQRPQETVALARKLEAPHFAALFDLLAGRNGDHPMKLWFSEYGTSLGSTEQRLTWAALAWHEPRAPDELAGALRAWCAATDIRVDARTLELCGDQVAQPALRLLLAGVPLRLPALQLAR